MTRFFRLIDADDKERALKRAIDEKLSECSFNVNTSEFKILPGSPFAYWVSKRVRDSFRRVPPFESSGRTARQGLATADDFRFLRLYWEVEESHVGSSWFGFAKGGSFSPFYADLSLLVNWRNEGREIYAFNGIAFGKAGAPIRNPINYFRRGLTWPLRTNGLSFRAMPEGCIFGHKGPAVFVSSDAPSDLMALTVIVNSKPFGYLVALQLARTELAQSYEVGLIQQTPVPCLDERSVAELSQLGRLCWSLKRSMDLAVEVSHAFLLPSVLLKFTKECSRGTIFSKLRDMQEKADDAAFRLYGYNDEERKEIEDWASESFSEIGLSINAVDEEVLTADEQALLFSWCIGVVFNRFDIRLATGERQMPSEPEPFDPLPTRSSGMLPDGDPLFHPSSSILIDDPGHRDDLTSLVSTVLDRVEQPIPDSIRTWIAKEFFPLHIRMYSKSRRKAPIYWQLATPSASYSVWLYIHAFTSDTLYTVQNDYVVPKLALEERRLSSMRSEYGPSPSASERKEIASQETLVDELRTFLDEVKRIAPLWNPDLDDGVVINFSPLWRLVPQNKGWQKEVKRVWDALCGGEYDWAHQAMHLWPERVVPKCASDRSIAIAHGMEDMFWVEGGNGKWEKRPEPLRSIDDLVKERTAPAVKAALESLMTAPVVTSTKTRARRTVETPS